MTVLHRDVDNIVYAYVYHKVYWSNRFCYFQYKEVY